jgi:hypothetical protein
MRKLSLALLPLLALSVLIGTWGMTHASNSTDKAPVADPATPSESGPVATDEGASNVPPPEGWVDKGDQQEEMTCSTTTADAKCKNSNLYAACGPETSLGRGMCIGAGCCCPQARLCRSGSFPFCCPRGKTCHANGTPYLECR